FAGEIDFDAFVFGFDLNSVVNGRQAGFGILNVEGRANHLGYVADVLRTWLVVRCGCHDLSRGLVRRLVVCTLNAGGRGYLSASTPPMISMISPVICDWRARL